MFSKVVGALAALLLVAGVAHAIVQCATLEEGGGGSWPSDPGRMRVSLTLEDVDELSCFGLVLRPRDSHLQYLSWTPDPALRAETYLFPFEDAQGPKLVLMVLKGSGASAASLTLGIFEFAAPGAANLETDLAVEFAEGAGTDGEPWGAVRAGKGSGAALLVEYPNRLESGQPNPFNPSTAIRYSIQQAGHVELAIYNIQGQLVRTLVDEVQSPKAYRVLWDGRNNQGQSVGSGIYFARLTGEDFEQTQKLVLVR